MSPTPELAEEGEPPRPTCLLRQDWDSLVLGFADGTIARTSLKDLLSQGINGRLRTSGTRRLYGEVTFIRVLQLEGGKEIIVAGSDDGGVGVWNSPDLNLLLKKILFASPLVRAELVHGYAGMQEGLVLVSGEGTIAFVDCTDSLTFTSLIPCASSPLIKACLSTDTLIILYANNRARLWDVRSKELWRIMEGDKAKEMIDQGGWGIVDAEERGVDVSPVPLFDVPCAPVALDAGISALLAAQNLGVNPPLDKQYPDNLPKQLHTILPVVAASFTYGLDQSVDGLCDDQKPIGAGSVALPSASFSGPVKASEENAVWQVSPTATTFLLLSLITVLRICLPSEVFEMHATAIIAFYVSSLPETMPAYQSPSLDVLVRFWYDPSSEIQHGARLLFNAVVSQMADSEVISIAELWQRQLPCVQPDASQNSAACARALLIAGTLAAERYSLLSTSTLRDISKSISLFLHAETCPYSVLAIDLCSRGFHIWQQYIDAVETLRCLFRRAVTFEKSTLPTVGHQARLAILHIASTSTALFMTTVSLDIVNAPTAEHLKSIMLVIAFIVKKKPLVLYPSLPKLVDAVVKSLDPNSSSRDAVLQAATIILDQLVHTYPSVAFNAKVQRLAVGTIEGAVIMYDLKTATRLYVLEAHRKRVSACSFSPDGRRLVSMSLEESVVMVWKVGTSFSSLFNPGGPPRQGHAGSDPYKTIPFSAGEEGHITVAATLEWVTFEWPGDRTARLKIRDSTFTFNT
ncbi:hypothetical protein DACRYDRAFT_115248 [Dacryopinax primogenitus]|uniref:Uncharacterized protein n=1 Tax=Dacryopinax primogenitus (strain DJM 731) TaxID=1858805 RepID=M5G407_DACPD|nr:uncharacterized protein DACRYDRAFT_115248 [Dacryopinax primogenitus]EJU02945.1 hypothetical protein DACRYDRAFT_115248 [Dacryopinax primogenitus]